MELGEKIRIIRKYRKMTQKQLGMCLGYEENSADVRIAQYEKNKRIPKEKTRDQMADILQVSPVHFQNLVSGSAEDFMQLFLWQEEASENRIIPTSIDVRAEPGMKEHFRVELCIENDRFAVYLQEWMEKKRQLYAGEITKEAYLEWKLGWPGGEKGNKKKLP